MEKEALGNGLWATKGTTTLLFLTSASLRLEFQVPSKVIARTLSLSKGTKRSY